MSKRILHMMCTALLVLAPHLMMQGCSSTPEDEGVEEGVESAENTEANGEEGNVAEETTNEGNENVAEETGETENFENTEGMQSADENLAANDTQTLEGEQTQSDLEGIIAGQNAEQAPTDATPVVDAAPAETEDLSAAQASTPAPVATVSAGPALPEQGSKMPYIVRVGDSLSSVAKMIYGSTERWSEMAELSSIKNPNLVRPGDVVYYQLNQETLAFATAYEGAARNEVTIQKGDTLAGIAQRVYGNQGDWKFVWRQNSSIENPDRLEVGQTIHYLSPATLSAAIDYAKSLTIAELLGTKVQDTNSNSEAPAQTIDHQTTDNNNEVNGFELATGFFNVFSTNFANAG